MKEMIVLPLSKDLWIAPEYDKDGNIVARKDNVSTANLPQPSQMTPDQMAMLMAQVQAATPAPKPE